MTGGIDGLDTRNDRIARFDTLCAIRKRHHELAKKFAVERAKFPDVLAALPEVKFSLADDVARIREYGRPGTVSIADPSPSL
jgi:hypothetical protein